MKTLKYFQTALLFLILSAPIFSQEYEWNLHNSGSTPGERIVAIIDAGDLGSYDGLGIVGTVIDGNGNWGYDYPTFSHFSAFVRFSQGLKLGIIQDIKTNNIILRFRKISATKMHLTANIPYHHKTAKVIFRVVVGNSSTLTLGDQNTINSTGELILSNPTYGSIYTTSNNTGNVGVGTLTPDAKLSVNGNIHTKEVKVDLNGWSDFVFENSFELPTLDEVEQHIKKNGHLKDIPSAKEVEQNGIYLGKMDAKLLQKIEELTLYTIQQEKKIDELHSLKQKNEELEARLQKLETLIIK